ncbi:MAG: hypothetical protein HY698_11520 [Deltaproteobacteria bacterium]|nr:hypothetical protein [Deltaproteobacteria bacterium]
MACLLFVDERLCRCLAVRDWLVPSHHERERFCRSSEPRRCPTYRAYERTGEPIGEEDYYRLWLPPRRTDDDEQLLHGFGRSVCNEQHGARGLDPLRYDLHILGRADVRAEQAP